MKLSLAKELIPRSQVMPAGYLEDVLSGVKIDGDTVELTAERYAELVAKYRGQVERCQGCGQ